MMDFNITVTDGNIIIDEAAAQIIRQARDLELAMKAAEIKQKAVRQAIMQAMEQSGVKRFENDDVEITYIDATTRNTVDTKALKEQGLYESFLKQTPVKASVRVAYKYD